MSTRFYESDFEEAFLQLLQQDSHWKYSYGDDIHRELTNPLIEEDLTAFLRARYQNERLTSGEIERITARLRNTSGATDYLALRSIVTLYRDGFTFSRDDTSKPDVYINFIDFAHAASNRFRAVNQFPMQGANELRRPDILLFINGIPVCIIELKNPAGPNATIYDAWEQIHTRYWRDIPGLLKFCALSCISDGGTSRLGTSFTPYEHYYAWKKVNNTDKAARGINEVKTLINGALSPERILSIIRDYVYFPDIQKGQQIETALVCRYPQYFATEKLYENIIKHIRTHSDGDGKGGTYFGATGCGKTFTMLFLARQLIRRSRINPTVIIIVDREDLETQSGNLFEESTDYLGDRSVRTIRDRNDLKAELTARQTGGVFITTIQKFCEETGLLTERPNVICFSDEAHRSQTNLGEKLSIVIPEKGNEKNAGAHIRHGFAQYLRDALPNATYVGFSGTPIDETIHVFGEIVLRYTMKESVDDGITVPLRYEARLARVLLDSEKAREIEDWYKQCQEEGESEEKIARSKSAMSRLEVVLGNSDRLERLAADMAEHYEAFSAEQTGMVPKAMIVCANRTIAYDLYKKLEKKRPDWFVPKRVMDESEFDTPEKQAELQNYQPLPMVNLVATRSANDPKDMFALLGDKTHRQMLDREFKKEKSNFRIAIVVDMWITGFDVPSLAVLYNDKPLQRHTLIQTISRVNRTHKGKEYGLIVDYIGIRENMQQALKQYGGDEEEIPDIEFSYSVFANELQILKDLMHDFDSSDFFRDNPLQRLMNLQQAAEYILAHTTTKTPDEKKKDKNTAQGFATLFGGHVRRMKSAYAIVQPAGRLNKEESAWAQYFMAIQSIIRKTTDSGMSIETMNKHVEQMVREALACSGVETALNIGKDEDIFTGKFVEEIDAAKLPHTKFQLLVKLLKKAIKEYKKTNGVAAERFDEKLQKIVEQYNTRDNITFTTEVISDTAHAITEVVNDKVRNLANDLSKLLGDLKNDRESFKKLGISFEEKAFFDILVQQREEHQFEYPDEKAVALSKKIRKLIDNTSIYAGWLNNDNLKSQLYTDILILLYENGYPPEWNQVVFDKVMAQVKNFKKYNT